MINIVLIEPEIPQNTGNIARTCAATGATLHLVGPLGFSIDDKHLKRAGLDYWSDVNVLFYQSIDEFFAKNPSQNLFYFSARGTKNYTSVDFTNLEDVFLIFGRESVGLPESLLVNNHSHCLRVPMLDKLRSLNLSNTVAIALYEVLRQKGFENLTNIDSSRNIKWTD